MYQYKAIVKRVVDADTIDLEIDLGFYMTARIRIRLARVNAWETRGLERIAGIQAKTFVETLLADKEVLIETEKTGKYGRWIAEVFVDDSNLSDVLVKFGHARYVDY